LWVGLLIGLELTVPARPYAKAFQKRGLLAKETKENTIRFAPPLVISREEIDWAIDQVTAVFEEMKEVS